MNKSVSKKLLLSGSLLFLFHSQIEYEYHPTYK